MMTDTDRALAGKRRQVSHPSPAVPSLVDTDETSPFDLPDPGRARRRHGDSVSQLAARLRGDDADAYDQLAALTFEVDRIKRDDKSGRRDLEKQLEAFLKVQPGSKQFEELVKDVAAHGKELTELAPVRRGLRWLQASVVLVVIGIGGWLYARGGSDTATLMRIDALEKKVERIESLIYRALGERAGGGKETP